MEILTLIILFFVAMFGSFYGALVGGSLLVTVPTLLAFGVPPHVSLGTSRLGVLGSNTTAWIGFHKKGYIRYKVGFFVAIPILIGSIIGANIVLAVNENILKYIIGGLIVIVLFILFFKKDIGIKKQKRKINLGVAVVISLLLGIYSGFIGAGFGTFLTYLLIIGFGQTFLESAATRKIAALISNIVVVIIFALNDKVDYLLGFTLLLGASIGAYLSTKYSDKIGNVWIKRMFAFVVIIMVIRLFI